MIELYIDSNVFIYSFVDNTEQGEAARAFMEKIVKKGVEVYTSPLVLDEVMWVVQRLKGRELSLRIGKAMLSMPLTWLDITYDSARYSLEFYVKDMNPRDAFHLGIMKEYGIRKILTEDADFEKVEGFKRLSIKDALEENVE